MAHQQFGGDSTEGFGAVSLRPATKADADGPDDEAMGFAGYLAAQFPASSKMPFCSASSHTLFSQLAVHTFASKFHDRTDDPSCDRHNSVRPIPLRAVVNQLHANQPFDDLVHNRLAIAFLLKQSFA